MRVRTSIQSQRVITEEQGFTLIELIVVLVIMPIIIGAIAFGLVSVFQLQNSTSQRLSGSIDLQKVSSQFVRDVQDSEEIYLGTTPQQCGSTGSQLLGLGWNSGKTMVSYVSVPMTNNSTNYMLERLLCTLGNFNTPVTTTVLSADFYVNSALLTQNPPTVCLGSVTPSTNCVSTSNSYNAHNVAAVSFTMYVPMSSAPYTMVVSPRGGTSADTGSPYGPSAGITLLGSCTTSGQTVLTLGNGTLNIETAGNGQGSGSLGLVNCPAGAVSLANNGNLYVSGILTGISSSTGISTPGGNPGTPPPPVTTDTGLCNWLQTSPNGCLGMTTNVLNAPTTWKTSTTCGGEGEPFCGTCPFIVGANNQYTYTCYAGFYSTAPTFKNGSIINLIGVDKNSQSTPDVTEFATDFVVPNGATVNFNTGSSFVFAAPDAGAFTTGTSNQKNAGIDLNGTNVLLYAPTGGITFSNNTVVQLSGSQTNGYVDVWDNGVLNNPVSGDGTLTLGANATSSITSNVGGIYVPYGEVVNSNNGTIDASFILAGSASFSNGFTVNIYGYG